MYCPSCGMELPDHAVFCPECGTPMKKPVLFCSSCGADLKHGASFCESCGTVIKETSGIQDNTDKKESDPQFEQRRKLTWGSFLKHVLVNTGKAFLKSLPLSILFFIVSLVVHTYLLVGVNQGFSPDTVMGREILASRGNVLSATLLWTVLSTLVFSAIIFMKRKGIGALIKGLIITPKQIIAYIKDNASAAPAALLTGAGLALIIAGVISKTTSLALAAGASVLFATPVGRLAAMLIRNTWNSIWELLGVKRKQIKSYVLIEAYLNMAGTACAFVLAMFIPGDAFIGIILLGAATAMMLSSRDKGGTPVMPLFLFIIALMYFIGDGVSALEGFHLLADDGGESEAGGWANWLGSPGSYQAIANGILPSVGAAFGPALTTALNAVDPSIFDVDSEDEDADGDTSSEDQASGEYEPEYDEEGFDQYGFDKDGYDRDGFDRDGYDRNGIDSEGYDSSGYDKDGYDRDGQHRDGYDSEGYDKNGYDQQGYDKDGYDREGYDLYGYDRNGYNEWGYNRSGYDKNGFDRDGFDENGYDKNGFDPSGYNKDGFDKDGYDRKGYNSDGFNRDGFNKDGFNKDGYDRDGYDKKGFNKDGWDSAGYDKWGFDKDGKNVFGETKDEFKTRIRQEMDDAQWDSFVERWGERGLWVVGEGTKFLCDKSIDVLEKLTGPAGAGIKKLYQFLSGVGGGVGEALIDGKWSEHLFDGAVKGGKDVLMGVFTGKVFDFLGGGKLESIPGFRNFSPFNPKDPGWGSSSGLIKALINREGARAGFVKDALLGTGGIDSNISNIVKDRVMTAVKHTVQNHLQTAVTKETINFGLDKSGIDDYTGKF